MFDITEIVTLNTLTKTDLLREVKTFASQIYRFTSQEFRNDGKSISTYFENAIFDQISYQYAFTRGNSTRGIDFPDLLVDLKMTSNKQPQSSAPYYNPEQYIWGLGYDILLMVYNRKDIEGSIEIKFDVCNLISNAETADRSLTSKLLNGLQMGFDEKWLAACIMEDIDIDFGKALELAKRVMVDPPVYGKITISPATQVRLNFSGYLKNA